MMCAATVNCTLVADIKSPAAYVMFKGTIKIQVFSNDGKCHVVCVDTIAVPQRVRTECVQAFIPPSTVRFAPVMYEDSGPATNATIAAISSTRPYLSSAVAAFCGTDQSPEAGFNSVSIGPGCTLLTVMPRLPISLASAWVNSFTAPIVAEYGTSPGTTTRSPTDEQIMMMRPPLFMCFSAAGVATNTPRMLMSSTRSISSSVASSNGFGMAVTALFTSTSSRPKVATVFSTAALTASASAASA